jgi:hypothetical protein
MILEREKKEVLNQACNLKVGLPFASFKKRA